MYHGCQHKLRFAVVFLCLMLYVKIGAGNIWVVRNVSRQRIVRGRKKDEACLFVCLWGCHNHAVWRLREAVVCAKLPLHTDCELQSRDRDLDTLRTRPLVGREVRFLPSMLRGAVQAAVQVSFDGACVTWLKLGIGQSSRRRTAARVGETGRDIDLPG